MNRTSEIGHYLPARQVREDAPPALAQTVVLGLGNLVHADDGIGVHAIHALEIDRRVPRHVTLVDGGTQGLGLLSHLSGVDRLLVIDAIDAGESPGTLLRFEGNSLRGLPGKASVHQLGFADLMVALQLLGDSPGEVIVLGVQPLSTEWGAELTPVVAGALAPLVDCVTAQLKCWEGQPVTAHDRAGDGASSQTD